MSFWKDVGKLLATGTAAAIGGIPAAAVTGGMSLVGDIIKSNSAKSVANKQIQAQYGLMGYGNQLYQQTMRAAPKIQIEGLKQAGISPQFANGSTPVSMPATGQAAAVQPDLQGPSPEGAAAIYRAGESLSRISLQDAQTTIANYNGQIAAVDFSYRKQYNESQLKVLQSNFDLANADVKLKGKQYDMMLETWDTAIKTANETSLLLEQQARNEASKAAISELQETRDALLTLNYPEVMRLSLAHSNESINNLIAQTKLFGSESLLAKAKAQTEDSVKQLNLAQVENIGYRNIVAGATVAYEAACKRSQFIVDRMLADEQYVPTKEDLKAIFEMELELKRCEKSEAQFNVSMQDQRKVKAWLDTAKSGVDIAQGVVGLIFKQRGLDFEQMRSEAMRDIAKSRKWRDYKEYQEWTHRNDPPRYIYDSKTGTPYRAKP